MTDSTITMERDHELISSARVEGTPVFTADGERVGHVKEVMLHKKSGQIAYAVMSFGGFLGIGERYHPLPWDALDYDTKKHGYVVSVDKEALRNAPTIGPEESERLLDRGYLSGIYDYYGSAPYWM
jgi:sporulation protein YlmC with PRC-barrel domain